MRALPHRTLWFLASSAMFAGAPAMGPLRVSPGNPRYFARPDGRPVLLVGAHTWDNLVDMGETDTPAPFDFPAYLDFLEKYHHNFIRLWAWESTVWDTRSNGKWGKDFVHHVAPQPWVRTGPGLALDGKPKFDLREFDPAYFERLRSRVAAAGERGIYVSIMLFEGWGMMHANLRPPAEPGWAWRSHPFHPANNINGTMAQLPADSLTGPVHSLVDPVTNQLQTAYIRHVVDAVNDLDNVLYEVINEGGEQKWDWWVVKTVHNYEKTKPKQHPIGLTGHGAEKLASLLASPADWISPGSSDGYGPNPPAWDGAKVSLLDTDHVWGIGGTADWAWKAFLRGHNPLFMDPYDGLVLGKRLDPSFAPVRRALGEVRRIADGLDLARTTPQDKLASTGYCLANPGQDYLVYLPTGGPVTVDLSAAGGELAVEWLDPDTGKTVAAGLVPGGAIRELTAPSAKPTVLHIVRPE